jgi:hypothetical protein
MRPLPLSCPGGPMHLPLRTPVAVGAPLAALLVIAVAAVHGLVLHGAGLLAVAAVVAACALVAAVVTAYILAREIERQVPQALARPDSEPAVQPGVHLERACEPRAAPAPAARRSKPGFQLREARPGEIPAAYLAAVMKGAQARHTALKARSREA